jgi:hypothetical protein
MVMPGERLVAALDPSAAAALGEALDDIARRSILSASASHTITDTPPKRYRPGSWTLLPFLFKQGLGAVGGSRCGSGRTAPALSLSVGAPAGCLSSVNAMSLIANAPVAGRKTSSNDSFV